jgi:hypothetical protein
MYEKRPAVRRLTVYALAALAVKFLATTVWIVRFCIVEDHLSRWVGFDFATFWSAARVAMAHGGASIFSPQWMLPMEVALGHDGYSRRPYPPTFLLAILPFKRLPFGVATILYSVLGVLVYYSVQALIPQQPYLAVDRGGVRVLRRSTGTGLNVCRFSGAPGQYCRHHRQCEGLKYAGGDTCHVIQRMNSEEVHRLELQRRARASIATTCTARATGECGCHRYLSTEIHVLEPIIRLFV